MDLPDQFAEGRETFIVGGSYSSGTASSYCCFIFVVNRDDVISG
jgi:hypothetical protein